MIRTILWFIYFWALLLQLIPRMIRGQRYLDRGQQDQLSALVGQVVPTWARRLLWAAGVTVEVRGREHMPPDPALYVANHQGNFDIPLLLANLGEPKGIVAKLSLSKFPFVSTWMRYFGCVFIDPSSSFRKAPAAKGSPWESSRQPLLKLPFSQAFPSSLSPSTGRIASWSKTAIASDQAR